MREVKFIAISDMTEREFKAFMFASTAHFSVNQVRKYTGEPYIHHPMSVVSIVKSVPHTPDMIDAAFLHDTVEDTDVTLGDIERNFGASVALLVEMLTDVSRPEDGNRAARKAIDLAHTAQASPAAKTIKLADLIDNSGSILEHDPKFAETYLQEKRLLLEVLKEGDASLWNQSYDIAHIGQ